MILAQEETVVFKLRGRSIFNCRYSYTTSSEQVDRLVACTVKDCFSDKGDSEWKTTT